MSKLTREPLVVRGAAMAALGGVLHALVMLGVVPIDPDAEQGVLSFVDGALGFALVLWSRKHVTPVKDPQLPDAPAGD